MARYAKISALGPRGLEVDSSLSNDKVVDVMRAHWREHIERVLPDHPDLIVLHEACDRPPNFSTERSLDYYRDRGNLVRDEIASLAREGKCSIAYSAARQWPDGSYRNATEIIDRSGQSAGQYHKNHLVPVEYENAGILYGKKPELIRLDFGSVSPVICFDLNYTELLDQVAMLGVDIIIFSSMYHGGLMQAYWAYATRAFFAGAICGLPCSVISPVGKTLAESTNYFPRVTARINLDRAVVHLDNNWDRIEAARDKYGEGVRMDDPGFLGAVLLSCELQDITIKDILSEFGIITLDEYFADCRAHRKLPGRLEP